MGTFNFKDFENKFNPDIFIPIAISGIYGKKHRLELGVGQTLSSIVEINHSNWELVRSIKFHTNFIFGYRYHKVDGGFLFKISYTPIVEFNNNYRHWGAVSFGYVF
jgi:hypothetical protein